MEILFYMFGALFLATVLVGFAECYQQHTARQRKQMATRWEDL